MTTSTPKPASRTDDLLASGAETQDGARGFEGENDPASLQTGMEGIANATTSGNKQSDSRDPAATSQTVPDNAGQVRNRQ